MLGESGVGKTSIVQRFVTKDNFKEENPPTIGASFVSKLVNIQGTDNNMKFQIWDTAGQEKYRSLASMYYKDAQVAIIVYDISKRATFEAVKFWNNELKNTV